MSLTTMYPSIREASAKRGVCRRFPAVPRYGADLTRAAGSDGCHARASVDRRKRGPRR